MSLGRSATLTSDRTIMLERMKKTVCGVPAVDHESKCCSGGRRVLGIRRHYNQNTQSHG